MWDISSLADKHLSSQEGLCCNEYVRSSVKRFGNKGNV
jgi:hypothetical protein